MLYLERHFANGCVFTVVRDHFRVLHGRFGNFRFGRVTRHPDSQDSMAFSDVHRDIRAHDDDRPFQREVRRFQIRGDRYQGIVQICTGRFLANVFISGRMVSDRFNDDSYNDERYRNQRDLVFNVNRPFREFRVYRVQVIRCGAGAFYHVGEEAAARYRSGVDAKDFVYDRAVLCVNGDEVNFCVAMGFVEGLVIIRCFSSFNDCARLSGIFVYGGGNFLGTASDYFRDGCAPTAYTRVEDLVWGGTVRNYIVLFGKLATASPVMKGVTITGMSGFGSWCGCCLKELGTAIVSFVYSQLVPSNSGPVFLTTVWVGTSLFGASV